MQANNYGEDFGARLKASATGFVSRSLLNTGIAVTEVRAETTPGGLSSPLVREDSFIVAVQLRNFPHSESWVDGCALPITAFRTGDTVIYDNKREFVFHCNNPFHSVHFYIPRAAFDAIARNADAPFIGDLHHQPGMGVDDPIMRGLTQALLPSFEHPEQANRLFVEHVTLAVGLHAATTYGGMKAAQRPPRGGLAPWQERRAKEMIAANLNGDISPGSLAGECRLSVSHFSRAFRQSTGCSPHQWLLQCRVGEAKRLLRDRRLSLTEIALACGFTDQSHLTRVFTRLAGISPGAWRRTLHE